MLSGIEPLCFENPEQIKNLNNDRKEKKYIHIYIVILMLYSQLKHYIRKEKELDTAIRKAITTIEQKGNIQNYFLHAFHPQVLKQRQSRLRCSGSSRIRRQSDGGVRQCVAKALHLAREAQCVLNFA